MTFCILANTTNIMSMIVIGDITRCKNLLQVSAIGWSRREHQNLAKLFKFLAEKPWPEVRRAKGASQYLLCFQKYINRLKINPKKKSFYNN